MYAREEKGEFIELNYVFDGKKHPFSYPFHFDKDRLIHDLILYITQMILVLRNFDPKYCTNKIL